MLRVAIIGTFAASLQTALRRHLRVPCDLVLIDEAEVAAQLADAEVVVTMAFTREMSRAAHRLKLVQVAGAGLDRIDPAALPRGVALANVYGHETGIAEYAMGAMLALTREFGRLDTALRRGEWQSQWAVGTAPPPVWPELAGKTLAILGYGRIGRETARRARAFDMHVRAIRRDYRPSEVDDPALLGGPERTGEVLQGADYVLIAMPATQETIGCIGRAQLALMKPSAFLINVARAEIVDQDALFAALAERRIAGAALDVWYRYPIQPGPIAPADRPFHELPNLLMTPHISGWTEGMIEGRARVIAENIRRVAEGEAPLNRILV